MAGKWTPFEVEAVVTDYFAMLLKEMRGEPYSKAAHRRALMKLLADRSEASVEYKHQNISAVLIGLGYPYIEGYKPAWNYQHALADAVRARLSDNREIEPAVLATVEAQAEAPLVIDILSCVTVAPAPARRKEGPESGRSLDVPAVRPTVNYLERESRNRSLGRMGEEFALEYETARLTAAGEPRLAKQVDHVAVTQGDGLGYDILSFNTDGTDRLIEVKTTGFGIETPFFVSRNELRVSDQRARHYHLYRVFTFRTNPRLYVLQGGLSKVCEMTPVQYLARVG